MPVVTKVYRHHSHKREVTTNRNFSILGMRQKNLREFIKIDLRNMNVSIKQYSHTGQSRLCSLEIGAHCAIFTHGVKTIILASQIQDMYMLQYMHMGQNKKDGGTQMIISCLCHSHC